MRCWIQATFFCNDDYHLRRLLFEMNQTKVLCILFFINEKFKKYFIFLPAFYLIMCLMKSPKNFEKIAILKIWQLVSFWGVKTHFGEIPLKRWICRNYPVSRSFFDYNLGPRQLLIQWINISIKNLAHFSAK